MVMRKWSTAKYKDREASDTVEHKPKLCVMYNCFRCIPYEIPACDSRYEGRALVETEGTIRAQCGYIQASQREGNDQRCMDKGDDVGIPIVTRLPVGLAV